MRSETAFNLTNLEGHVDTSFSETLQNISVLSTNILDLKQNNEDMGLEIMNLNYSVTGLNQDVSMKLKTLNTTQVRILSMISHVTFVSSCNLSGKHYQWNI